MSKSAEEVADLIVKIHDESEVRRRAFLDRRGKIRKAIEIALEARPKLTPFEAEDIVKHDLRGKIE